MEVVKAARYVFRLAKLQRKNDFVIYAGHTVSLELWYMEGYDC
jgi:hypothetical protein